MATIYGDHGPTYGDFGLLYGEPTNAQQTATITARTSTATITARRSSTSTISDG